MIKHRDLFDLPAATRAKVLASIGLTEDQYRARQVQREKDGVYNTAGYGWGEDRGLGWPDDHLVGRVEHPSK